MALTPGQRLGAYEVVSALGAGGMGEVYRARDTKLQRDVAIKVLPESLANDRDRLARFEREAQLLAALNHPHIAAIYGVDTVGDTQFLVLELVDGETLADRIARGGALPVNEAVAIARQIAEALQVAHDKGIVHRDLKPGNIALTADNQAKVLDFGLAKAMEGAPAAQSSAPGASMSPTLSLAMTEAGFILGTAAYMSPEQAKGRPADKRSDVWAFGCVLFEMLTGKRAFEGEDASDTLAGILRGDPDWTALPRNTPPHIREILTGCLAKDRKQRLADIAVVSYLLSEPRHTKTASAAASNRRTAAAFAGAVVALVAAATGLTWWSMRGVEAAPPVVRFSMVPPTDFMLGTSNTDRQLALSADGLTLAYIAAAGQLVLRRLDRLEIEPLRTVTDARVPFWSPDGKWVGFTLRSSNELQKVSVTGGPAVMVSRGMGPPRGASWGPDQAIVFATADGATGLLSVPESGGDPRVLTKPDVKRGEVDHLFPSYLPNGKGVLFTITTAGSVDNSQVAVLDLQSGAYKVLVRGGTTPEYVRGFLVYAIGGTLRAARFDQERLEVVGDPVPVVDAVFMANNGVAQYSTSRSGSLIHLAGGAVAAGVTRSLVWVDQKGVETPIKEAPARMYTSARLSQDDLRVALSSDDQERDIHVYDFRTRSLRQVTFGPAQDAGQLWYANDERLLFFSQRDGAANLYSQRADGVGAAERITKSNNNHFIPTMSPGGKVVVIVEQGPSGSLDLTMVRLNGSPAPGATSTQTNLPATKTEPLVTTMSTEIHPEISPNGRWIAYTSDRSGRRQVIVQPFPGLEGTWKVSVDAEGGDRPLWSRSGKELFYATLKGTIMAVPFEDAPTFEPRTPIRLFDWPTVTTTNQGRSFDISRDGKRFLMIKEGSAGEGSKAPAVPITVSLNWIEELKEKLPAK